MSKQQSGTDIASEATTMFELGGKSAFVPGGYGDIGRAITWGLAARGARVAIAGRNAEKCDALAAEMTAAGFQAIPVQLDATNVAEINRATDQAAQDLDGIDIMVNCVGTNIKQPLGEVTEQAFDEVYQTNLKSAMFLGQAVARHQIAAGRGGRQIHMLSVSSARGYSGQGYSAYCSTKGAMIMLVRQHALELAPHGILVNGVAPTYVMTDMIREAIADPALRERMVSTIPLGRIAETVDIVGPTLFFASPASEFVTGQVLYIDGGVTANR